MATIALKSVCRTAVYRLGMPTYKYENSCCHLRLKDSHTHKQQFTSELGTKWSIDFYIFRWDFISSEYEMSSPLKQWQRNVKFLSFFNQHITSYFHCRHHWHLRLSTTALAFIGHSDWWIGGFNRPEWGFTGLIGIQYCSYSKTAKWQ